MDFDARYRAVASRDERFDGFFYTAVTSTGIYCRPSCPAITPRRENVRFYPTSAAAQAAGFRACKRCVPGAAPGSPEWSTRADVVGRAMRLIGDGVVDREGVPGLAHHLGYSERQVHRHLARELGTGPLALARALRAHTARTLLEATVMPATDIAFASGFASIRQFNDTIREVYAATPSELRARRSGERPTLPGLITLWLAARWPFDGVGLLAFLAARAVPGVEEWTGEAYRRSLRLPHGSGIVELTAAGGGVSCSLRLDDPRDLAAAVARVRRLADLDADPVAIDDALGADPMLRSLVRGTPGRRVPGAAEPAELAVRAVLGQQVSVAGARTIAGRLTARYGEVLRAPVGAVTRLFPSPEALAAADPADLPMPGARRRAVLAVAAALAEGSLVLHPGADRDEAERALLSIPGIGPWTAAYVRMRALGDPDAFLPTDLGVVRAMRDRGGPADPRAVVARAEAWRPWRAYAVLHLWSAEAADETDSAAAAHSEAAGSADNEAAHSSSPVATRARRRRAAQIAAAPR
jgi:AraC family transcriptional regulator of adaptative response / DNA-3-methyladenine glycosylase II